MTSKKPIPTTTRTTEEFWHRLSEGEFCVQACDTCGEKTFPPRLYCINCYSDEWSYQPIDGEGTVYGYTVIHRTSSPDFESPVVSAIVELAEGPRVMARVACEPEEIEVGRTVVFDPSNLSGDDVRVTFELAD